MNKTWFLKMSSTVNLIQVFLFENVLARLIWSCHLEVNIHKKDGNDFFFCEERHHVMHYYYVKING